MQSEWDEEKGNMDMPPISYAYKSMKMACYDPMIVLKLPLLNEGFSSFSLLCEYSLPTCFTLEFSK